MHQYLLIRNSILLHNIIKRGFTIKPQNINLKRYVVNAATSESGLYVDRWFQS